MVSGGGRRGGWARRWRTGDGAGEVGAQEAFRRGWPQGVVAGAAEGEAGGEPSLRGRAVRFRGLMPGGGLLVQGRLSLPMAETSLTRPNSAGSWGA